MDKMTWQEFQQWQRWDEFPECADNPPLTVDVFSCTKEMEIKLLPSPSDQQVCKTKR